MQQVTSEQDYDRDSLYILPLSTIPLVTSGLQRARLIKNSRLVGMVELFSGVETGSGQVAPSALDNVFHFDDRNKKDLEVIKALSPLPSYDVYSLRLELRQLGIEVDDCASLRLSEKKKQELHLYMREFTRPLVTTIFTDEEKLANYDDLMRLLFCSDDGNVKNNLVKLSQSLSIDVKDIPAFLQNYADVYLSLAYYQYCLDQNIPYLRNFLRCLDEIKNSSQMRSNTPLINACTLIDEKLKSTVFETKNILEMFKIQTADMWCNLSWKNFSNMTSLILAYQTAIGGALCAITVKMNAWIEAFPDDDRGSLSRRADFVMHEIRHGIDAIKEIKYSDDAYPKVG